MSPLYPTLRPSPCRSEFIIGGIQMGYTWLFIRATRCKPGLPLSAYHYVVETNKLIIDIPLHATPCNTRRNRPFKALVLGSSPSALTITPIEALGCFPNQ